MSTLWGATWLDYFGYTEEETKQHEDCKAYWEGLNTPNISSPPPSSPPPSSPAPSSPAPSSPAPSSPPPSSRLPSSPAPASTTNLPSSPSTIINDEDIETPVVVRKRLKRKIIESEDENNFDNNKDNDENNNNNDNNYDYDYDNDYEVTASDYRFYYGFDEQTPDDLAPDNKDYFQQQNREHSDQHNAEDAEDAEEAEDSGGPEELDMMQLHREELRMREVILRYLPF